MWLGWHGVAERPLQKWRWLSVDVAAPLKNTILGFRLLRKVHMITCMAFLRVQDLLSALDISCRPLQTKVMEWLCNVEAKISSSPQQQHSLAMLKHSIKASRNDCGSHGSKSLSDGQPLQTND